MWDGPLRTAAPGDEGEAREHDGHRAIADFEATGRLLMLVTQNIDGLHQLAGSSPGRVIELHGNARRTMCWSCGDERTMGEALDRVRNGEDDPLCLLCGGILKS